MEGIAIALIFIGILLVTLFVTRLGMLIAALMTTGYEPKNDRNFLIVIWFLTVIWCLILIAEVLSTK